MLSDMRGTALGARGIAMISGCVLFGFAIAAVPKSGVRVGGFPIPFLLVALVAVGSVSCLLASAPLTMSPSACMLGVWAFYRVLAVAVAGGTPSNIAALIGWYLLPIVCAAGVLAAYGVRQRRDLVRGLESGFAAACLFALAQRLVGVGHLSVPGLTIALHDSYGDKYNGLGSLGSKIPSTYQGGNNYGIMCAVFLFHYLAQSADGLSRTTRAARRRLALFSALALGGLFLSGSRTAELGAALGYGLYLLIRTPRVRTKYSVVALLVGASVTFVVLDPAVFRRMFTFDPTGSGRTIAWSQLLHHDSLSLVFGATEWSVNRGTLVEGVLGACQQVGVLGVALLVIVYWRYLRRHGSPRWWLVGVPLALSFCIDSTYLVFPTLFIPLLLSGGAYSSAGTRTSGWEEAGVVHYRHG